DGAQMHEADREREGHHDEENGAGRVPRARCSPPPRGVSRGGGYGRQTFALVLLACLTGTARAARPNVVVYVIDTLRADHLGCYGYTHPTSPRIDAFARSAVRFGHAVAQSSWTLPSIASILTGMTPPLHGAVSPENAIAREVPTLAQILRAQGYTTVAFVTNYLGSGVFGLDRGFATYRFYRERGDRRSAVYLGSEALVRRVVHWLQHASGGPFLLYVHATDPHFPYVPPRRYAVDFLSPAMMRLLPDAIATARPLHNGNQEWGTRPAPLTEREVDVLRDAYDGDIRMADESFGRLLDAVAAHGMLDDTIVVLTSDHGEEFLEHGGVAHGQTLYAETLDVPLLVRLPKARDGGTVVDALARQVDILPTILDVAGVPAPPGLSGSSLFRPRVGAVEAHASLRLAGRAIDALVGDGWKVVRDEDRPPEARFEVYRTDGDPGEHADRSATEGDLLGHARTRLEELATPRLPGPRVPEERLERVRSLGYVDE
ncbi:MAG TPA: sulfatase, partial [Candidatus Binatia bacterium]|nr:sulfatase [Candidatus Binatia bacterium]